MTPDELSQWTPIGLTVEAPEPTVDWCDLRGVSFREPFFSQTVTRWTTGDSARPVIRTALSALLAVDGLGSCLEPSGFIFHFSRCGSTLASRLLASKADTLVISEADPINALLELEPERVNREVQVQCLRLLIRALGRIRLGSERHYVIKFSSWTVTQLSLLHEAFPRVPCVWIYRDPAAVLASILARPPGWMQLRFRPRQAEFLMGACDPMCLVSPEAFAAHALASFASAALAHDDRPFPFIDYQQLPKAVWQTVAPTFRIPLDADAIAAMQAEARWTSWETEPRPFVPVHQRPTPVARLPAVPERLADLYQEMVVRSQRS